MFGVPVVEHGFPKIDVYKRIKIFKKRNYISHAHMQIRSIAGNSLQIIPAVSQSFQFHIFHLSIKILVVH
jgi:hypothetical protein